MVIVGGFLILILRLLLRQRLLRPSTMLALCLEVEDDGRGVAGLNAIQELALDPVNLRLIDVVRLCGEILVALAPILIFISPDADHVAGGFYDALARAQGDQEIPLERNLVKPLLGLLPDLLVFHGFLTHPYLSNLNELIPSKYSM